MSKAFIIPSLFLSFLLPLVTYGAVQFKSDLIELTANVNQDFEVSLPTLLSDSGSGTRRWSVVGPGKPGWVNVDSDAERMFGRPSMGDKATSEFRLAVQAGESGAITMIRLIVKAPPIWDESPLNLGEAQEDNFFGFDLKTKVMDPLGGTLSFSATNLPAWLSITPTGLLSGTPRRPDVGDYSGIQITATNVDGNTVVDAFGTVSKTIKPPFWKEDPITATDAFEDSAYSFDLAGFVDNFEQAQITYSITVGPAWVNITTNDGKLVGTPTKPHIGPVSLEVRLQANIEGQQYEDTTRVQFNVIHVNHPPTWTQSPVVLPDGPERVLYSQSVRAFAEDIDEGDTLSFEKFPGLAG